MYFWIFLLPLFSGKTCGGELGMFVPPRNVSFERIGTQEANSKMFSVLHQGDQKPIDVLRNKYYGPVKISNIYKKVIRAQDNPNKKQAMMAHAFVDSVNEVFKEDHANYRNSSTKSKISISEPRLKANFSYTRPSWKITSRQQLVGDGSKAVERRMASYDKDTDEGSIELDRSRVHCARVGTTGITWVRDNYTYSLDLPANLMKQDTVESLVSAICNAVEEERSNQEKSLQEGISIFIDAKRKLEDNMNPSAPQLYYSNQYPITGDQEVHLKPDSNIPSVASSYINPQYKPDDLRWQDHSYVNSPAQYVGKNDMSEIMHKKKPKLRQVSNFNESKQKLKKDESNLKNLPSNIERLTEDSGLHPNEEQTHMNEKSSDKYPPPVWTVGKSYTGQSVNELFEGALTGNSQRAGKTGYQKWAKDAVKNQWGGEEELPNDNSKDVSNPQNSMLENVNSFSQSDMNQMFVSSPEMSAFQNKSEESTSNYLAGLFPSQKYSRATDDVSVNDVLTNESSGGISKSSIVNRDFWNEKKQFDFDLVPQCVMERSKTDARKKKSESTTTSDEIVVTQSQDSSVIEPQQTEDKANSVESLYDCHVLSDNDKGNPEDSADISKPGIELGLSKSSPVIRISIPIDLEMIKDTLQSYYQYRDELAENMKTKYRRESVAKKKPFTRKFAVPTSVVFTKRHVNPGRNRRGLFHKPEQKKKYKPTVTTSSPQITESSEATIEEISSDVNKTLPYVLFGKFNDKRQVFLNLTKEQ